MIKADEQKDTQAGTHIGCAWGMDRKFSKLVRVVKTVDKAKTRFKLNLAKVAPDPVHKKYLTADSLVSELMSFLNIDEHLARRLEYELKKLMGTDLTHLKDFQPIYSELTDHYKDGFREHFIREGLGNEWRKLLEYNHTQSIEVKNFSDSDDSEAGDLDEAATLLTSTSSR